MTPPPAFTLPVPLSHGFPLGAWLTLFRSRRSINSSPCGTPASRALGVVPASRLARRSRPVSQSRICGTSRRDRKCDYFLYDSTVARALVGPGAGLGHDPRRGRGPNADVSLEDPSIAVPSIYLAKLLAAWCVTAGLATMFTFVTFAVVHYPAGRLRHLRFAHLLRVEWRTFRVVVMGVCRRRSARFTGASSRWILPLGVAYIVLFEGVFANIDFMVRRLTVLWYVRILAEAGSVCTSTRGASTSIWHPAARRRFGVRSVRCSCWRSLRRGCSGPSRDSRQDARRGLSDGSRQGGGLRRNSPAH